MEFFMYALLIKREFKMAGFGIAFSLTEKEVNIQLTCLLNYLGGGGRLGDPEARPLGTFETNHKMARRSYGKIGDCERSISTITDCN